MVDVVETTETIEAAPGPNWDEIEEEILCPLCDYNLRGLVKSRCPECGYRFEWAELLDPSLRRHPYVFEHHPRHNLRSFWQTLRGTLRPRRFWSSLHPAQPSSPRRLWLYIAIVMAFASVPGVIAPLVTIVADKANDNRLSRQWLVNYGATSQEAAHLARIVGNFGSLDAYMDFYYPRPVSWRFVRQVLSRFGNGVGSTIPAGLAYASWPLLTFAALMVFQLSMRRAKVNPRHVLRCVAYSFDIAVWVAVIALFLIPMAAASVVFGGLAPVITHAVTVAASLSVLIMVYRLWTAYRLYLRFDFPLATVVASQVIVVLAAMNILVFLYWA